MNIVFDIGGTNMRVAVAEERKVGEMRKVLTPQDFDETLNQLTEIAHSLTPHIEYAGGCIAGQIDAEGRIFDANHRLHWNGRSFSTELSACIAVPVAVENDCAVIGLAECLEGAGEHSNKMAYVTVSTGVGAAHIVDGRMMPFEKFFFGHAEVDGAELETLISGTAIRNKFNIEPKNLDSIDERNKLADTLARGLVILLQKWPSDTIVLGGSMIIGVNPIPLDRVAETLKGLVSDAPVLKMAQLGDNGGLVGGAILAQSLARK